MGVRRLSHRRRRWFVHRCAGQARSTLAAACDTVMFRAYGQRFGHQCGPRRSPPASSTKPRSTIARSSGSNVSSASRLGSLNSLGCWRRGRSRGASRRGGQRRIHRVQYSAASCRRSTQDSSTALVPSSSGPNFPSSALDVTRVHGRDPTSDGDVTNRRLSGVPIPMTADVEC